MPKKIIVLIATCFLVSCNEMKKESVEYIISGTDTLVITGYFGMNLSKTNGMSGHNDTTTGIFYTKFENSFKKDTVYIHDTIIKIKEVMIGNGVFFKPDSNKDSVEEIIITPTSKL